MADGPVAEPGPRDDWAGDGRTHETPHDETHELSIAALLDRDLTAEARETAETLARSCPTCTHLLGDLRSLAAATRTLPEPVRPRDFRLTPADADRLVAERDGEPRATASRLTGEMQVPSTDHRRHDRLLVASLLDRSTDRPDRGRAESRIASCAECAALHKDLLAISDAARAIPTPVRPRDYALTPEDARRLWRTGWRRVVAMFGSTRDAFSRPLAIGLTTIGLAGLLVAGMPNVLPSASSSAAAPMIGDAAGGAGANAQSLESTKLAPAALAPAVSAAPSALAPAPAAAALPAPSAEPVPSGEAFGAAAGTPGATAGPAAIAAAPADASQRDGVADQSTTIALGTIEPPDRGSLMLVAALLAVVGLGLFGLRWAGRRV